MPNPLVRPLVSVTLAVLLLSPAAALGEEPPVDPNQPPVGATDAVPVGSPESTEISEPAGASASVAAVAPNRYFGTGPYQAVREAVAATALLRVDLERADVDGDSAGVPRGLIGADT